MHTHVTFTHATLDTDWEALDPGNPNCLGEEPAKLIIDHLQRIPEIQVSIGPSMEDWGCATRLSVNDKLFLLASGLYEVDDAAAWLVWVESDAPFYKRWFGVRDSQEQAFLCRKVHSALAATPDVSNIRWHTKADFMRGNEDDWTETPDG